MVASAKRPTVETAGLLELEAARELVLAAASPLPAEAVALEAGLGRVLAEDATATVAVPAFDGSAMDGFAVRVEDLLAAGQSTPVALEIVGESRAGAPSPETLGPGQAIAISTGAVLPAGADAVVRIEDTKPREGVVEVLLAPAPGLDVRRAGEDVRVGETVLAAGTALGAAELGVLASLGLPTVRCTRRPRLSLLVTGDELLGADQPARAGAVRDSNSLTISALARRGGAEVVRLARVGDDAEATSRALIEALAGVDVAVICGGVSVGAHDHIRPALSRLGAQEGFWGIALKPGHPTWFGTHEQTLVFGLPGNPVSAMVTFLLLVGPALRALLGLALAIPRLSAVIDSDYRKPPGRTHALRCRLSARPDGWHVVPTGAQGSHILTSMLGADALALIPAASTGARAGEHIEVEPLGMWVQALS